MTTTSLRASLTAAILASPLAAAAGVVAVGGEGPSDATSAWNLLGALAPFALWGLPLAYVVFTVVSVLPRGRVQDRLAEPRDATFVDRLSLFADSREGW
jgi:hypothetical protein